MSLNKNGRNHLTRALSLISHVCILIHRSNATVQDKMKWFSWNVQKIRKTKHSDASILAVVR